MEILVVLGELAAVAKGIEDAVVIVKAIQKTGATKLMADEIAKVRQALASGLNGVVPTSNSIFDFDPNGPPLTIDG